MSCFADWKPPVGKERVWQHFLYWMNRDMHLRGLAGERVFPDASSALVFASDLIMGQGLALRLAQTEPVSEKKAERLLKRRRGQFLFDLAMVHPDREPEPIQGHQFVFAWDVVRPTGAAVAYAQITGNKVPEF